MDYLQAQIEKKRQARKMEANIAKEKKDRERFVSIIKGAIKIDLSDATKLEEFAHKCSAMRNRRPTGMSINEYYKIGERNQQSSNVPRVNLKINSTS